METKAKRRARLGVPGWRAVLRRFEESGLSVREFCEREGLGQASFYRWRKRLSDESVHPVTMAPREAPKAAGFLDLGTLSAKGTRLELRLDLGAGVVMHLVRG
ncbi:MAG TPA: transposase [Candidatus Paceibacterota bacterium]|nr:transposase [Candidatus Paceibacterota bacterium]